MEEIKNFVICLFDTGLQLVPKSWFVPNSLENVMFPSYKTESRIMKAVRNEETPQNNSLWDIYQVLRIMGSDDDFDKAWKKLLKARYISDISSEESDIEKAKRRERAKKLPDANFTSSDGGNEIPLLSKWKTCTSCPKTNSVNTQLEESDKENMEYQIVEIADIGMDVKSISDNDNADESNDTIIQRVNSFMSETEHNNQFNEEMYSISDIVKILKELTHKITRLIIENEKVTKTLTELDRRLDRRFSLDQEIETENNEDIINRLPLATEEHILEMEHFLLEKKNEKKLLQILEEIGGSTVTEMTRRVMNTLFTSKLCMKYTLKGKRAHKGNFGELRVCKVIEKAVIRKVHSNQAEIQKVIEKWLIRAKDKVLRSETIQCSRNEHT